MRRVTKIILPAIVLTGILALMLTSGSGCGSKPTPPAVTMYYELGQSAQSSREVLTAISTEKVSEYKKPFLQRFSTAYNVAPPGTVFVILEVSVTNVGQEASLGISYQDFYIKDSLDRVWPSIGYNGVKKSYPSRTLASGQSDYGYLAFNVLETATGLQLFCVLQGSPPVLAVWRLPY